MKIVPADTEYTGRDTHEIANLRNKVFRDFSASQGGV